MLSRLYNRLWELFWRFREWEDFCEYPWGRNIIEGDELHMYYGWEPVNEHTIAGYHYIAKEIRGTVRRNYQPLKHPETITDIKMGFDLCK